MSEPLVAAPKDVPSSLLLWNTGIQYRGSSESHGEYGADGDVSPAPSGGRPATRSRQLSHPTLGLMLVLSAITGAIVESGATPTWKPSAAKRRVASCDRSGATSGAKRPVCVSVIRMTRGTNVLRSAK